MSTAFRWTSSMLLLVVASAAPAANVTFVPARSVDGSLDAQARMQAVHAEMKHECSVAPGSERCHRLKREFQQEAKNCQKQHRK